MILSDLLTDTLGRIEESDPPVFWNLQGEVYVAMVDALFEAALITGVVQANNVLVTLAANTTYFSLQNNTAIGIPVGVIAALRMRAPWAIRKTSLIGLDNYYPAWQQATPGSQITAWFPLGVSAFGIYPQLASEATVTMDFIQCPVNEARPYSGSEIIPLQDEFTCLLSKYAAAALRAKEGGVDAEESETVFQQYLEDVKALSLFQTRLDSLVYSSAFGSQARVNPREVV